MNAYESGSQKIIPAVLLYAFFENRVLMIYRDQKQGDIHQGKWNGLGGKIESGETAIEAAAREFEEECHCKTDRSQWQWGGTLNFPNFKPHKKEDWWVTVFTAHLTATQFQSIAEKPHREGTLKWIPKNEVLSLNLWPGDLQFLPHVLKGTPFEGTFFYLDGKLTRFECHPLLP